MRSDVTSPSLSAGKRGAIGARPPRPWLLIVAALLLAVLSTVLWVKWVDTRVRAERLQAEIRAAYAEAEVLRTQAARAQQRVLQLEKQLRDLSATATAPPTRSRPTRR